METHLSGIVTLFNCKCHGRQSVANRCNLGGGREGGSVWDVVVQTQRWCPGMFCTVCSTAWRQRLGMGPEEDHIHHAAGQKPNPTGDHLQAENRALPTLLRPLQTEKISHTDGSLVYRPHPISSSPVPPSTPPEAAKHVPVQRPCMRSCGDRRGGRSLRRTVDFALQTGLMI